MLQHLQSQGAATNVCLWTQVLMCNLAGTANTPLTFYCLTWNVQDKVCTYLQLHPGAGHWLSQFSQTALSPLPDQDALRWSAMPAGI